ncbi:MAG: DUF1648 domain-containing protein [Planctomycetes bacterium]|nr:DUF1648 domain-containing protein [Planctomycetota bacterium]
MLRYTLVLSMLAVWGLAVQAWPDLPARIPMHYDLAGQPDGWVDKSLVSWFGVPAFGTLLGVVMGLLLPRWVVGMARRNSPWLNVPDKKRFMALSEAGRVRAVQPVAAGLSWVVLLMQGLLAWLVVGGARVATGEWAALPSWPMLLPIAGIGFVVVVMLVLSRRCIRQEVRGQEAGRPICRPGA